MENDLKVLYIDCSMGAAGDMLGAALFELVENKDNTLQALNNIGLSGVTYVCEKTEKQGIVGTRMRVLINGEEEHNYKHVTDEHRTIKDIEAIVDRLNLPEIVRHNVMEVYNIIATAESVVHGKTVTEVHFHEVGSLDAIADIAAVSFLINELKPDKIIASPVHTGSGEVHCAHGILPVPAPATAYILKGIPMYGGKIKGELCTPTGAALLKMFVASFGDMPMMTAEKIGYGVGYKDFERANVVRAIWGISCEIVNHKQVAELSCNLDDMTSEHIGFAMDVMFKAGALDVYTTSIGMKKNRMGIKFSVICSMDDREKFAKLIFKHTTTIGIRETLFSRYTLERSKEILKTDIGEVGIKISKGYGVTKEKYEYDDMAKIAGKKNMSIAEVEKQLLDANLK